IAGGHNIAAEANLSGAYGQVSNEFILKQNPAWLLATYYGKQPANLKKIVAANDAIKQTIAWKRNNIIAVKANYLNQPAPRVVWPIINITKELHPIAYREAKQTPTPTKTATPTTTVTPTQTQTQTQTTQPTTTTSPPNGQPGFTPIIALIAIVGTLLGWRRIRSS
ncbi:MAG: PGF-CTERM sorting domain-containing protein, partial [Halobacteriaceae archaeon]